MLDLQNTYEAPITPATDIAPSQAILGWLVEEGLEPGWQCHRRQLEALVFGPVSPATLTRAQHVDRELAFVKAFSAARAELREKHQRELISIGRGHYQIIHPADQTDYAQDQGRKEVYRALRKERAILDATDTSMLTPEQVRQNSDARAKAGKLQVLVRSFRRGKL